jgi:hypothetical protein
MCFNVCKHLLSLNVLDHCVSNGEVNQLNGFRQRLPHFTIIYSTKRLSPVNEQIYSETYVDEMSTTQT